MPESAEGQPIPWAALIDAAADVITSAMWPVIVLVLAWWFRKAIRILLSRLKHAKSRWFDLLFGDGDGDDNSMWQADTPDETVSRAWHNVEFACRLALRNRGLPVPRTFKGLGGTLWQERVITESQRELLSGLRNVKRAVEVAGQERQRLAATEVDGFVASAKQLVRELLADN